MMAWLFVKTWTPFVVVKASTKMEINTDKRKPIEVPRLFLLFIVNTGT
jgi:hypothetical protein